MNNLATTLLTGGAMGALAAAPAAAGEAPNFHLAVSNGDHALVLKNGSVHGKTDIYHPPNAAATETAHVTFTYAGKESTMYKKSVFLGNGTTWYITSEKGGGVCKTIPNQKTKVLNKPKGSILKIGSHTYKQAVSYTHCHGTLTFYGPDAYFCKHCHTKTYTGIHFTFVDYAKYASAEQYEPAKTKYSLYAYQDWTVNIE